MKIFKIGIKFYLFIFAFFSITTCTQHHYEGLFTIANKTDYNLICEIHYKRSYYYDRTNPTVKTIDKSWLITSGSTISKTIRWGECNGNLSNLVKSGDIQINAYKANDSTSIIFDKEYTLYENRDLTVWIEHIDATSD
jgi:hypothetical protein